MLCLVTDLGLDMGWIIGFGLVFEYGLVEEWVLARVFGNGIKRIRV